MLNQWLRLKCTIEKMDAQYVLFIFLLFRDTLGVLWQKDS